MISTQPLDANVFIDLAAQSGWCRMTQNALDDDKRRPFVLDLQPIVITKISEDHQLLGAIGGINYGAYAFLQYMMVPSVLQGQGHGTQLLQAFQNELIHQTGEKFPLPYWHIPNPTNTT